MAPLPAFRKRPFRAALALAMGLALVLPLGAVAQQREKKRDREEKKAAEEREKEGRQYTISDQRTGKRLHEAHEFLKVDDFAKALEVLDGFEMEDLNPYEKAVVYQFRAHAYASQDKYEEASAALKLCLDQQALPPAAQLQARFNLAQMYMMLEHFEEAVREFELWFAETETPSPSGYFMLAMAYYQAGNPEGALEPAEKAVALSDEPREPWLQLLVALYLSKERWADARPLVEQLVTRFPKKSYWVQLAAVYFSLEEDERSFAVQQLAEAQGLLTTDRELRRLAQMYLYNDLPYRAAGILETSLQEGKVEGDRDAWQILGNSWLAAREFERAIEPLRKAAELSDDGEAWLRIGQVHVQREEWDQAVEAVQHALAKGLDHGGPNTPCHGHLLVGIARYNQERIGAAKVSVGRARACDKTAEMAERWLTFLDREETRLKALKGQETG